MSFASYTAFRSNIVTWLDIDVSAIPATQLDDIITLAENKINREVRSREQETAFNATVASGVVAVPSNLVSVKSLYVDGTPAKKLERANLDYIYTQYPLRSSDGKPKHFAREGGNFVFGPYPDSTYTIKGTYYQRLPAISTTLHALFTANEDLYLMAALSESELVVGRDSRMQVWEAKYQQLKNDINNEDWNEQASGGMAVRPA